MKLTRMVGASALVLVATAMTASPAHADPKGDTFEVECKNGQVYLIVVNGNGQFTPGLDTQSTTVLVPTSIGNLSFVVTDENDNIVFSDSDPDFAVKGMSQKKQRATTTSCTFSITEEFVDPELGEGLLTGTFSGEVTGFTTPVRGVLG